MAASTSSEPRKLKRVDLELHDPNNPTSPVVNMLEPDFAGKAAPLPKASPSLSNSHKFISKSLLDLHSPERRRTASASNQFRNFLSRSGGGGNNEKKSSSRGSYTTSIDEDEGEQHTDNDNDDQSNGSLSDSMTNRQWDKNQEKTKKMKKKNRISAIIAGVTYKSKSELFQKLFKDMTSDEQLILDYSCALHRDILVHGRLYLSQNWLCFYANIFGWETLVTIQWSDITAVTKEKTVKLIPNAIRITTDTEKYFFTTFVTREHAYTGMFRIWQNALLGHPMNPAELKAICKKFRQKKQNHQFQQSKDELDGYPVHDDHDETGDEVLEDEPFKLTTSVSMENLSTKPPEASLDTSTNESIDTNTEVSVPGIMPPDDQPPVPMETSEVQSNNNNNIPKIRTSSASPVERKSSIEDEDINDDKSSRSPKPTERQLHAPRNQQPKKKHVKRNSPLHDILHFHKKKNKLQRSKYPSYHLKIPDQEGETTTDFDDDSDDASSDENVLCPCHDSHSGKEYVNEEFNLDVDALYEHLFAQESDMMKRVFEARTFLNWKYTPLEKDENGELGQTLSYTLPLNYSIGPSQSDTVSQQTMSKDNKAGQFYVVNAKNTSAGVPYSDSFCVLTRYCITRLSGNRSRLKVHGEVKYHKKVFGFVKNMISKSADEALVDYFKYVCSLLRAASELIPNKEVKPRTRKKKTLKSKSKDSIKASTESTKTAAPSPEVGDKGTSKISEATSYIRKMQTSPFTLIFFLFLLASLFFTNIYLMRRLNTLENTFVTNTKRQSWLPSELPKTKEDWQNLLEYQQGLHELEILKLKNIIKNTGSLVQQVETSIKTLYDEIDKFYEEKPLSKEKEKQEL